MSEFIGHTVSAEEYESAISVLVRLRHEAKEVCGQYEQYADLLAAEQRTVVERDAEIASLKEKLRAAEEERDDFRKRLAEMRAGVSNLNQLSNDMQVEMSGLRQDLEDARTDLASVTKERDELRSELADCIKGNKQWEQEAEDAHTENAKVYATGFEDGVKSCATGPWKAGKPEVMDGREVLVLWTGGDPNQPVVVTADSDQGWVCVDRWAEFNKEGGAE